MQFNNMCRKVLYVFLSFAIVYANVIQANAASSWNVNSAKSSGARVIIGATNGGYKSAVNIPPNLGKLLKYGLRGANIASWALTAASMLNDGVDFVLDPANNRVKYKSTSGGYVFTINGTDVFTLDELNAMHVQRCKGDILPLKINYSNLLFEASCKYSSGFSGYVRSVSNAPKYVPLTDLAPKLIESAQNGNAQAQALMRDVATAAVIAGDYDQDLLSGAVPINDSTKPVIPAIPGAQVGDVNTGMTGGDVGASAQDALDRAEEARKQAAAAADAANAAADAARAAADAAKDLINQAVDQAIKDAAQANAAQAAKDAADAQKVADAAAAEAAKVANEAAAKAEKAAAAQNAKVADAQKALDAAKATGDTAAITAAQVALDRAKAEAVAADAAAARAKEKAKEAAAAKPEAKPFELPAFCSWATVVCDYIDWVKTEYGSAKEWVKREPEALAPEPVQVQDMDIGDWQGKAEAGYVSFESQCPADVLIPVQLMGASQTLTISYAPFCHFAGLIRYAVILGAWISGLLIISGGRSRE